MTILFKGGELGAFIPANSNVGEETISGSYNPSFARCAMSAYYSSDYYETAAVVAGADMYCHFDLMLGGFFASSGTLSSRFVWLDNSGNQKVRLAYTGTTQLVSLDYWNGAAWVSVGTITLNLATRQTLDIRATVNSASGTLKLYVEGTLRIDGGTVDLSAITSLGKARFYGVDVSSFGSNTWASQVVIADEPTIGMRLLTRYPSAAGATSSWTGAFTDIDEVVHSDADFILSAAAGQISTFSQTGSAISGYTVRSVGVTARARCGAAGPQNIQMVLRVSGTDYFSATKALDVGYGALCNIWETNPATAAAWLNTAVDAIQPGAKSIA